MQPPPKLEDWQMPLATWSPLLAQHAAAAARMAPRPPVQRRTLQPSRRPAAQTTFLAQSAQKDRDDE